jgi:hypothetical protein
VLLLDTDPSFCERLQNNKAFALLSEVNAVSQVKETKPVMWKMIFAAGLAVAMIVSQIIVDNIDTGMLLSRPNGCLSRLCSCRLLL